MQRDYFLSLSKAELDRIIQANVEESVTKVLKEFGADYFVKSSHEDNDYFTIEGLTQFLGCSEQTIHTYKRDKGLPYFKEGRTVLFKKSEVLEWMRKNSN